MSMLRRTAAAATDLACHVTGRHQVVRAARFVLRRACLDVPNDLHTNGEYTALQRWVLNMSSPGRKICVIDVGANVGRWTSAMLAAAQEARRSDDLDIHVFEPSAYTFQQLETTLQRKNANLHRMAVGDRTGPSLLHVIAPGAGTNSLHAPPGRHPSDTTEEVATTTLASYAEYARLNQISLVKIDTEGHDLAVLRGARELFATQCISVAQFEYNHRWIYARCYLRDAFELSTPRLSSGQAHSRRGGILSVLGRRTRNVR